MVKSLPANVGDLRDKGLSPELGRSPGGGHGNPLQYSSLGNPRDRGAWQATVHAVANGPYVQTMRLDTTEAIQHATHTVLQNLGSELQGYHVR